MQATNAVAGGRPTWDIKPYDIGLGGVVAMSAREGLTALLQRLPSQPMTARLVIELKKLAEMAKESQRKHVYGASWTMVGTPGKERLIAY